MSQTETGKEYRIECKECGAVAWGLPGTDVEFDKEFHRERCVPDAEFEVTFGD